MQSFDGFNAGFIAQQTSLAHEHKLKETSEKTGETLIPLETSEIIVSYETTVKTFLEVLSEFRKGYP
jgi:hypothetical protein